MVRLILGSSRVVNEQQNLLKILTLFVKFGYKYSIVFTEKMMIDRCDIFISYFGKKSSPGSVAELIYAASLQKPIEIFYLETDNGREIKTEYWFPIVMSRYIDENVVKVTPVQCANEFMEKLKAPL